MTNYKDKPDNESYWVFYLSTIELFNNCEIQLLPNFTTCML